MPRKRVPCVDCGKPTNGVRCQKCKGATTRVWASKGQAQRNHHFKKKYGITLEEFNAWYITQEGKCGICKQFMIQPLMQRGQPLNISCVDHDHKTGEVRGLLCSGCNKALGLFKDNIEFLNGAIRWLKP